MLPSLPVHDSPALHGANSELGSESSVGIFTAGVQRPYLHDVAFFEFGVRQHFPAPDRFRMSSPIMGIPTYHTLRVYPQIVFIAGCRASLGFGILHILGLRTREQMSGILTGGDIARMTDKQRCGVIPVGKPEGKTVSINMLLPPFKSEHSVSASQTARPQPALLRTSLIDVTPEPFYFTRGKIRQSSRLVFSHCGLLFRSLWSGPGGATNAARPALF